jgi:hypothetical protein
VNGDLSAGLENNSLKWKKDSDNNYTITAVETNYDSKAELVDNNTLKMLNGSEDNYLIFTREG